MRNVLLAGYPRSGNTYVGYLLSAYFNAQFFDLYIWPNVVAGRQGLQDMVLDPKLFSGYIDRDEAQPEIQAILKTHELPGDFRALHRSSLELVNYEPGDPTVLVVRRPEAAVRSYFYYRFYRRMAQQQAWRKAVPDRLLDWYYTQFRWPDFARDASREWANFYADWLTRDLTLVISYEEATRNPKEVLRRTCRVLGLEYRESFAEEAAAICDRDSMRRMEERKATSTTRSEKNRFIRSGDTDDVPIEEELRTDLEDIWRPAVERLASRGVWE